MKTKNLKDESVTLIIDRTYSTLNEYILECRRNKYKGAEFKKNDEIWTAYYIMSKKIEPIPIEWFPLTLQFTFYEKNTKRDMDNVMGYAHKIILDALQKTILPQDNWKVVRKIEDEFDIDKNNPRIELVIKPYFDKNGNRPTITKKSKKE